MQATESRRATLLSSLAGALTGWVGALLLASPGPALAQPDAPLAFTVRAAEREQPRVHLLASVAVPDTTRLGLSAEILAALRGSSRVVLRNDATRKKQNALLGEHGHLPEGELLGNWVGTPLLQRYARAIEAGDFPPGTGDVAMPWLAARVVRQSDLRRTHYAPEDEYELYVAALALDGRPRIEVEWLEAASEGYARLAALPRELQTALFEAVLLASERADQDIPALYAAVEAGDPAETARIAEAVLSARPDWLPLFEQTRFADNRRLAEAVATRLGPDVVGDSFFPLPAVSLVGVRGVVSLLRERGYIVEPLQRGEAP
jgi:uncharacterized protein YbaP (TraB family)